MGCNPLIPRGLTDLKSDLRMGRMYVPRLLAPTLADALAQFPAVLVTGPRQSGKTTFLLGEFGRSARYVTLDDPLHHGQLPREAAGRPCRPGCR